MTAAPQLPEDYQARLYTKYLTEIRARLQKKLELDNIMQVPRLEKVVLNIGVGEAAQDRKHIETAIEELSTIAGQRAVRTRAKQAIAGFKLREGMAIGARVTLRRSRMYEFVDRLVNVAMPRIRDFRGLKPSSFDGNGNYSFGLQEQIVFPEINYDKVDKIRGMDITFCTSTNKDSEAKALLQEFNFPFQT